MKHATPATLKQIAHLLSDLRALPGVKEKSPGSFYCKGSAFLHFHEDPAGLFVDMKESGQWVRQAVNSKTATARLVRDARRLLAG